MTMPHTPSHVVGYHMLEASLRASSTNTSSRFLASNTLFTSTWVHVLPQCMAKLRTQWCRPNGTAAQSATFHGLTKAKVNDTAAGVAYAEQVVADFLLTRGNWSWLG